MSKMREELFWDVDKEALNPEIVIERAINFGGFDFIKVVQEKYGMGKFKEVLLTSRGLSKKAVNYWCLELNIDRKQTRAFQAKNIWEPFR